MLENEIIQDDIRNFFERDESRDIKIDLSFLDPPFNQGKEYRYYLDKLPDEEYWKFMEKVCSSIYERTVEGGAIYFMQREKNTKNVIEVLENSNWTFQNLIIWKKKTSAVPQEYKFGLHYQIIVFATKGEKPRIFNRLRINPPRLVTEKYERPRGIYVTDVWDDIRELTSGYFAGDEAIRTKNGERFHKQQSPIALLLRIILSSTKVGDMVFDPFAGTGTTLLVAKQLKRRYLGVEIDPLNVEVIKNRLKNIREVDNVERYYKDYIYTENLDEIWGRPHGTLSNIVFQKNEKNFLFNTLLSKNTNG